MLLDVTKLELCLRMPMAVHTSLLFSWLDQHLKKAFRVHQAETCCEITTGCGRNGLWPERPVVHSSVSAIS
eukprot:6180089-Pleurochrysis_carterae.AAC.3